MSGEGGGDLVNCALGRHVGQLGGHGAVILAGSEHHDSAARATVVLGGKVFGQHQRRPCVHGEAEVELLGRQFLQRLSTTAGVVGDNDVQVPERVPCCLHNTAGGVGGCQIGAHKLDARTAGP